MHATANQAVSRLQLALCEWLPDRSHGLKASFDQCSQWQICQCGLTERIAPLIMRKYTLYHTLFHLHWIMAIFDMLIICHCEKDTSKRPPVNHHYTSPETMWCVSLCQWVSHGSYTRSESENAEFSWAALLWSVKGEWVHEEKGFSHFSNPLSYFPYTVMSKFPCDAHNSFSV